MDRKVIRLDAALEVIKAEQELNKTDPVVVALLQRLANQLAALPDSDED